MWQAIMSWTSCQGKDNYRFLAIVEEFTVLTYTVFNHFQALLDNQFRVPVYYARTVWILVGLSNEDLWWRSSYDGGMLVADEAYAR